MGIKSIATRRKYANSTIGKLKHENERLREALRETCRTFAIRGLNGDDKASAMHAIAREALRDE